MTATLPQTFALVVTERMVKNWCLNGTMVNTNKYSSPVPLIGLYTAAATLVCLLLIILDIWAGFRRRKFWLPCRLFSLHSVTLTLISISAKLPVDLTSPMPSSQDQLSKLTGTVFICMSMGFLMPSLGAVGEFESLSNLLALSVFVVTVVINICIQIATGVISCFIVEHAIILFCMLTLIVLLWVSSFIINQWKATDFDQNRDLIRKGMEESLLRLLQVCYLHGYRSSPQLILCSILICGTVSLVCTICVVVQAEVMLRSLVLKNLKFCKGVSAYGWSTWIIVGSQVLTIAVISFAIGCRWVTLSFQLEEFTPLKKHHQCIEIAVPFYMRFIPKCFCSCFRFIFDFLVFPCINLAIEAVKLVTQTLAWLCDNTRSIWMYKDDKTIENFRHLLQTHHVKINENILSKAVEDMERWMELNTKKSPELLTKFLSIIYPLQESLAEELREQFDMNSGNGISCLSILLVVEMAKVSIPNSLTALTMGDILDEVFQIICFVDEKVNVQSFNRKLKSMAAEVFRRGKVVKRSTDSTVESQDELENALHIISEFPCSFEALIVRDEAHSIEKIIKCQSYTSIDEFCDNMRSLFVEMLQALLTELPTAIFKHIFESPAEEYEDRVRLCMKFLCKLESIERYLRWSFPVGCNITSLTKDQVSTTHTQSSALEGNSKYTFAPVNVAAGAVQLYQQDDSV